ncbi:MAG: hypothetical protein H6Q74_927 [Firmicutes bacterium]|nr:hypothetical protein [Bacillota bacterium]
MLIDGVILWPITWVLRQSIPPGWFDVVLWIFDAVFYIGFVGSIYQGTPGKILLRLKVTDLEGKRISLFRSIKRYMFYQVCFLFAYLFLYLVNISYAEANFELIDVIIGLSGVLLGIVLGIAPFIGYLMVAYTERSQGLHDKIASTLVVVQDKKVNK